MMSGSWSTSLILSCIISTCSAVNLSNCRKPFGMQDGTIPDSALKASSSYDEASVGPANGRIRIERGGGAWCPMLQISQTSYEWIEIDLQELKVIQQVKTQGRFNNGQGQEFANNYMLDYLRVDGGMWTRYKDKKRNELLAEKTHPSTIIARRIRVVSFSSTLPTVCMRMELYSCSWRDGILSYSMP